MSDVAKELISSLLGSDIAVAFKNECPDFELTDAVDQAGHRQVIVWPDGKPSTNAGCLKCGDCCRRIAMFHPFDCFDKDSAEFMKAHWHPIDPPQSFNRYAGKLFESAKWYACDMLDAESGLCRCYETRPAACRNYPGDCSKESLLSDRCGFLHKKWRRVNG